MSFLLGISLLGIPQQEVQCTYSIRPDSCYICCYVGAVEACKREKKHKCEERERREYGK